MAFDNFLPAFRKKTRWFFPLGIATGLYATFVLRQLWNWFLVPTLNVGAISFWSMYGLHLFVVLLTEHLDRGWENDLRWQGAIALFEASAPEERGEKVRTVAKSLLDEAWELIGANVFSKVARYSITLALGSVVHTVLI
jgi:hypothetical protein